RVGWVWFVFFFSSRRRHTRFSRDWSSDVCSSDLHSGRERRPDLQSAGLQDDKAPRRGARGLGLLSERCHLGDPAALATLGGGVKIGRASCRERVERSGAGGRVNKK